MNRSGRPKLPLILLSSSSSCFFSFFFPSFFSLFLPALLTTCHKCDTEYPFGMSNEINPRQSEMFLFPLPCPCYCDSQLGVFALHEKERRRKARRVTRSTCLSHLSRTLPGLNFYFEYFVLLTSVRVTIPFSYFHCNCSADCHVSPTCNFYQ